jgi:hypothetical protein
MLTLPALHALLLGLSLAMDTEIVGIIVPRGNIVKCNE